MSGDARPMTEDAFRDAAALWGAAPELWPEPLREAGLRFASTPESRDAAARILADIADEDAALDALLDADPAPTLSASLTAAMLSDAQAVAAETARARAAPPRETASPATGGLFAAAARLVQDLIGELSWPGLGAASAAAAAGLAVGLLSAPAPDLAGGGAVDLASDVTQGLFGEDAADPLGDYFETAFEEAQL